MRKIMYALGACILALALVGCETLSQTPDIDGNNKYFVDIVEDVDEGFSFNKDDGILIVCLDAEQFDYEMQVIENALKEELQEYGFSNIVLASRIKNFDIADVNMAYSFMYANGCRYLMFLGFDSLKTYDYGGGLGSSLGKIYLIDGISDFFSFMYGNEVKNKEIHELELTIATTAVNNFQQYYPSWKTFGMKFAEEVSYRLNEISLNYTNRAVDSFYSNYKNILQNDAKEDIEAMN